MKYPFWALFIGVMLPYITASIGTVYKKKQFGKIDFNSPREQNNMLEGAGRRASAAQANSWEALIAFSTSFFAAFAAGVPAEKVSLCAIVWVVARVLYPIFYITDFAMGRVAAFAVGMAACLRLLALAVMI
ncbi:MAG: MAPEG family protein [Lentisphaeraceae bacterium]|nr:MAPEG family protein [Lentisphaeraceae bacterium]